jgi:hypothetical protein
VPSAPCGAVRHMPGAAASKSKRQDSIHTDEIVTRIALSITPDQLRETALLRQTPFVVLMKKVSHRGFVPSFLPAGRRHHASFQDSCCPALSLRATSPLPGLRPASAGRAAALPWLRPGIPVGSAAFVPLCNSGTHPCMPPQPRPSHLRRGSPLCLSSASPWGRGSAGRQSCRPPGLGDSPTPLKNGK